MEDEDGDGDAGSTFGVSSFLNAQKAQKLQKKKKKEEDFDGDDGHLSDDEGDEEVGETGKTKQRDRTHLMSMQLKKQGILLEEEEDGLEENEELFREHLNAMSEEGESGLKFQSGKEQVDYVAPSKEQLHAIFGKDNDNGDMEGFSMGPRASKHMYDKQGRVLEEHEDGENDAWLKELGHKDPEAEAKAKAKKKAARGMNAFAAAARLVSNKKADRSMAAPLRRAKDPLANLDIILSHVKPGETILAALRRLGAAKKKPAPARQQQRRKNVRTRPSASGMDAQMGAAKTQADSGLTAEAIQAAARSFEELTEAAQGLLDSGEIEIYSETYESVSRVHQRLKMRKEQQERAVQAQLAAQQATAAKGVKELMWQYKWNATDQAVHGPFVGSEMDEWKEDGYFKSGTVVVQRLGPNHPASEPRGWISADGIGSFTG